MTEPSFREVLRLDSLKRGKKTLELGITAVTREGEDEQELFSLTVRGENGRMTSISIRPNELDALACALSVARGYLISRTYKPRGARHRPPNAA